MSVPADRHRQMVARRRRVLVILSIASLAGLRAWVALGGQWWLAAAITGSLLTGYLVALAAAGRRRHVEEPQASQAAAPAIAPPTIAASVPAEALPLPEPAGERASRQRRPLSRRLRPVAK